MWTSALPGESDALEQGAVNLPMEFALRPSLLRGLLEVEAAFEARFDA